MDAFRKTAAWFGLRTERGGTRAAMTVLIAVFAFVVVVATPRPGRTVMIGLVWLAAGVGVARRPRRRDWPVAAVAAAMIAPPFVGVVGPVGSAAAGNRAVTAGMVVILALFAVSLARQYCRHGWEGEPD